jgi:hypothetical protein
VLLLDKALKTILGGLPVPGSFGRSRTARSGNTVKERGILVRLLLVSASQEALDHELLVTLHGGLVDMLV